MIPKHSSKIYVNFLTITPGYTLGVPDVTRPQTPQVSKMKCNNQNNQDPRTARHLQCPDVSPTLYCTKAYYLANVDPSEGEAL
ncbi:hypothetical protein E3N88_39895 [Mikania micrantha]|uniref:Uncharacterized protein n=1 Tax=Mikania micrantha TaxID=192012 RepID=A0A5N6LNB8_9ASTR|nr:hypothetical protein E3N88_39895 [Mikania micrantha]